MRSGPLVASALLIVAFTLEDAHGRQRALSFDERVKAQEAIERVYYSHQIGATLPFELAVPRALLEKKVKHALRASVALEKFWSTPVTAAMLERETERIVAASRMPERILELYSALGRDAFLFQETVVRAALVDRLARSFFASDSRIHAAAYAEFDWLKADLLSGRVDPRVPDPRRTVADGFRPDPADDAVVNRTWEDWWQAIGPAYDEDEAPAVARNGAGTDGPLAPLVDSALDGASCPANAYWDNGSLDTPTPDLLSRHTSVWTGSLMLVWGGNYGYVNAGARYDPAIDTWTPMATSGGPTFRYEHTAVWTGNRMIVWGGNEQGPSGLGRNTGGLYDPLTDSWTATPTTGAPLGRSGHTAVWTGKEMVVWGGRATAPAGTVAPLLNTGGRYDPENRTWSPLSTLGAPIARILHTAVWSGSRMIVWGGYANTNLDTGGRYDPMTDSWQTTSMIGVPRAREGATATWIRDVMVIWGGWTSAGAVNTGGRYDPEADVWSAISTVGAPAPRENHTAISAGVSVVIWGGSNGTLVTLGSGGLYDPANDLWHEVTAVNAPKARTGHSAVWTGSRMIVWGGQSFTENIGATGGRYDPTSDTWTPTSSTYVPRARSGHHAVWTGNQMLITGGVSTDGASGIESGRYDPALDVWTPMPGWFPGREGVVVWTGRYLLGWSGGTQECGGGNAGVRYDPVADARTAITTSNAPATGSSAAGVWTGRFLIVWGGRDSTCQPVGIGGRYDVALDQWLGMSTGPLARYRHTAVWTGSEMIIWGGDQNTTAYTNTGSRYDPSLDAWRATSTVNAPGNRIGHTAVWTGSEMIVWGGTRCCPQPYADGGRYDPAMDSWSPMASISAPTERYGHTTIWTGDEMIVWGGQNFATSKMNTGGFYSPTSDGWTATATTGAPAPRQGHTAVFTGTTMLVWGGFTGVASKTGGRLVLAQERPFYRDADGDGRGDTSQTIVTCSAPAGYVADDSDCSDADASVWGIPSEALHLTLDGSAAQQWDPPASPGAQDVRFDLLRSTEAGNFTLAATCAVIGSPALTATDASIPPAGSIDFFLVRARNNCPAGVGPLGTNSSGATISGRDCP